MQLTAGKFWSFRRLSDENGRFKMVAIDQRPPIMNLIRSKTGVATVEYGVVADIKEMLTRNLASECSAVLLDPIWGYSRSIPHVPPAKGLLLTIEDHEFIEEPGGRRSRLIRGWDAAKVKRIGADGVKLLVWYRPDADPRVRQHQQAIVESVGRACVVHDICFLLELLVYPLPGEEGQTKDYTEHSAKHPERVIESVRTFADPRFAVDIFKVESPIPASHVPPPGSQGSDSCQHWFDELGRAASRPWVMLSAGADMEAFRHVLTYAFRAGASGYLAGRAIWGAAVDKFPDLDSADRLLKTESIAYLREINRLTDALAQPWLGHPAFGPEASFQGAGPEFSYNYGSARTS